MAWINRPKARPMTLREQRLAAEHVVLAAQLARTWQVRLPHLRDELEEAALLGLVAAAMRWQPARGVLFRTYLQHRVRGAIRDMLRRELLLGYRAGTCRRSIPPRVVQASTVSEEDLEQAQPVRSEGVADGERLADAELRAMDILAERMVAMLSGRAAELLKLMYVEGYSAAGAAARLGVSPSRAGEIHAAAIARLREVMAGGGGVTS
jgi:RNA polymerase sigma factor (sigma-70 family)